MKKEDFTPLHVMKKTSKRNGNRGSLTMICSKNNGKRLMISEELAEVLGLTDTVKIGFIGDSLVLGKHLPGDENEFLLKKQAKKWVIYSAELVRIITEKQQLDFNAKVSHTWYKPIMDEHEGVPVVLFNPEVKVDGE